MGGVLTVQITERIVMGPAIFQTLYAPFETRLAVLEAGDTDARSHGQPLSWKIQLQFDSQAAHICLGLPAPPPAPPGAIDRELHHGGRGAIWV